MLYDQEHTRIMSFPLGGIGAGCIGLSGNGSLVDWEIFNRPAKRSRNGITHFAVRAEKNGKVVDFRILNGDLPTPYDGSETLGHGHCGLGYGPGVETMASFPHFRKHSFFGTWPIARMEFGGEKFPAETALSAWSAFAPGETLHASLPAAFFEIELRNNTQETFDYTAIGVLNNPWGEVNTCRYNRIHDNQLTCYSGDGIGDISLTADAGDAVLSHQTSFYRGGWRDYLESYRNDVLSGGLFRERLYESNPERPVLEPGLIAAHFTLRPGEQRMVRFILTWSIPVYEKYWGDEWLDDKRIADAGLKKHWRNYYATVWRDSGDSGNYALREVETMRRETYQFRDTLFSGTQPPEVLDAISANLSVLKSPTCLRLEDGTFYGWEGVNEAEGSCEGSCTHVWGYAQALPFLFPDLEKSMRASHLNYSVDEYGGSHFRLILPLGIHARTTDFRPCADGQFGDVMKIYRDWKISGDDEYVRHFYPVIRKTIEYAWSPHNPDRWDPEKTGVLHGRQHHTLDMELFGPNSWLTGHYLGALKAGAAIAEFCGDAEFAATCRDLFAKGAAYVKEHLFNGEYFIQQIDLKDHALLNRYKDAEGYWNDEAGEIKYQIDTGCALDAPLAQLYATLYGLGDIFDKTQLHSDLRAIFRYNFKRSMRDEFNTWRVFSMLDEGGVEICTWPGERRPRIPLTYNTETMTGFEWAFAAQLAAEGMVGEALEITRAIRNRFDGVKRNPWNEFECGNNYARSMASYALLPALTGFQYDRSGGMLGFAPKENDFAGFWAIGEVWGLFRQKDKTAELRFCGKEFTLRELRLAYPARAYRLNGKIVELPVRMSAGDVLEIMG